jgi:predicted O-linked N-acetylglucosamine transferase (SPINDLY family)
MELAQAHFNAGRIGEAEAVCRAIAEAWPAEHRIYVLWGLVAMRRRDVALAEQLFRQAITTNPQDEQPYVFLGLVLQSQARIAEAEECYRRALAVNPSCAEAQNNLTFVLQTQGRLAEAEESSRRAVQLHSGSADTWNNLAATLGQSGRLEEAEAACRKALEINPQHPGALDNLSVALATMHRFEEAEEICRRLLTLRPEHARGWNAFAVVLGQQKRPEEAEAACREALRVTPDFAEALNNLGMALRDQGRIEEASVEFFRAVEVDPKFHTAHSNALCCLQYQPDITPERLLDEHLKWDRMHGEPFRTSWPAWNNDLNPDRPLRVGFVSPDLGCHPVGHFLVRFLEAMKHEACHTICYSSRRTIDPVTQRLQAAAAEWWNVNQLSDEALAQRVIADRIDVLIDLAGHTAGDRMVMFAQKPAPIQMTWMGYTGTTGLAAMDYLLADRYQVPEDGAQHCREKVLRLPDDYVVFDPLDTPDVAPRPAAGGPFTLCSFNNPSKVNGNVVRLWARILKRLPESRLLLHFRGFDGPATQARYAGLFAECGVDPSRVEMAGWRDREELLRQYGRVDLALDPFPYGGGLTTCEALWMGVPVVTCPGRTFASRHSLTHLSNVGLGEFVARDPDEYLEIVVRTAGDPQRLATIRAGLRQQVAASPLCDGARLARNFLDLLRGVWREWVARQRDRRP